MNVTVRPESFTLVDYDAAEIAAAVEKVAEAIGFAAPVVVEVDESTPLARSELTSLDPVVVAVQSGAFEDPKRPRGLDPDRVSHVVGRWLLRVQDRGRAGFGDPPPDGDLALHLSVAWDTWAEGRLVRAGFASGEQRWRYQFRNRHGFTDVADGAFDRLWAAEELTWEELVELSEGPRAVAERLGA